MLAVVCLTVMITSAAHGGARRFTYLYDAETQPKGVAEYEQWITWKTHKQTDPDFNRVDFRHEFELGLTDRLQIAFYVSDWRYQSGASVDNGLEWRNVAAEVIYNLIDPITEPVGLALYGEIKLGPELAVLEGKLLVQANAGKWVLGWNGTIEAEWEGERYDEAKGEFGQAFGASYQFTPALLAGFELLHEIEYEDWSRWSDHAVYAGPNMSFRTTRWWITVTPMIQLTNVDTEPDFQLRMIFGFDF
jgi:hypothetical protein